MISRWDEWYDVDMWGRLWQKLDDDGFCMCCTGKAQVDCLDCLEWVPDDQSVECLACDSTGWVTCRVCGGSGTG